MSSPGLVLSGAFLVIGTMAFTVGAMYLGGGSEAVRRQARRLAMLAVGLVVVVLAVPVVSSALGDQAWIVVLLSLNAAVVAAWVRQSRRGDGPLVRERQRAAFRVPGFRTLVIGWLGALMIATILLILAAKAGY